MDSFKLKTTVLGESFEGEGSFVQVLEAYKIWLERIGTPTKTASVITAQQKTAQVQKPHVAAEKGGSKLFSEDGNQLILRVLPDGEGRQGDALLVSLIGYLEMKGLPQVTGVRLMQTLERSGSGVDRIDRVAAPLKEKGLLTRMGRFRGTKYQLTPQGEREAHRICELLLQKLPQGGAA